MAAEAQFLSFFGAVLILGPKSPSPASALLGVRWNYVKLVKAAVAHWRVVRGERAVFDAEWSPRMGVCWSGVKRKCICSSAEMSPVLFSDVHEQRRKAEISPIRLKQAAGGADLAPGMVGSGQLLEHAMSFRRAASVRLAFFGARRASEVAGLRVADVKVDEARSVAEVKVRCQKKRSVQGGPNGAGRRIPSLGRRVPGPPNIRVAIVRGVVGSEPRFRG